MRKLSCIFLSINVLFLYLICGSSDSVQNPVSFDNSRQLTSPPLSKEKIIPMSVFPSKVRKKIYQHLHRSDYEVSSCESTLPSGKTYAYQASNYRHNINAFFSEKGLRLLPIGTGKPSWQLGMTLYGYGYRGAMERAIPLESDLIHVSGNRIEFKRGIVTEWYSNDEKGLEQGVTLKNQPAGKSSEPLMVEWTVSGSLVPHIKETDGSIAFEQTGGTSVMCYSGLKAWDAAGRFLPAKFSVRKGKNKNAPYRIAFVVDDTHAIYPVYIDPTFSQIKKLIPHKGLSSFGRSSAISADTLVVGAPGDNAGVAYIFYRNEIDGDNWDYVKKITANDGGIGDGFGYSVSISNDTVVIGAPSDDDNGQSSGSIYIFSRNEGGDNNWGQVRKIIANDGSASDRFGSAVSVSDDTIVAGAYGDDDNGYDSGSIYIFSRNEGGDNYWGQTEKIIPSDGTDGNRFGWSVSIRGGTLVVGAYRDNAPAQNSGSAYIFYQNMSIPEEWDQITKITASDGAEYDFFGHSVSISGDIIVAGAWGSDAPYSDSGSAYIFYRNQGGSDVWGEVTRITADDGSSYDDFGYSVAISGDTIVVGAKFDDDMGLNSGSSYIFCRDQGGADAWGQVRKITASDGEEEDNFGTSVAIYQDTVVVGVPNKDDFGRDSGSVHIFNRNEGGADMWGQVFKIIPRDNMENDFFGTSIAVSGNTIAVGAHGDDENGEDAGVVYVFYQDEYSIEDWGRIQKIIPDDGSAGDWFGYAVALDGDTLVVGSPYSDIAPVDDCGAAYIFYRNEGGENNWGQISKIYSSDRNLNDMFGNSVSVSSETVVCGAPLAGNYAEISTGAAYIFHQNEGGPDMWGEVTKLNSSDGEEGDQFGYSVSVDTSCFNANDEALIAGAYNAKDSFGDNTGAAYIFYHNPAEPGVNWLETKVLPNELADDDRFGSSVSISQTIAVVGAPYDDEGLNNCGSSYIFQISEDGALSVTPALRIFGLGDEDHFGHAVSVNGDLLVVGAWGHDAAGINAGSAHIYEKQPATWVPSGIVTSNDAAADDRFGYSVSIDNKIIAAGVPYDDDNGSDSGSAYVFKTDDSDGDGVLDTEEQGPYGMELYYDGNYDGIADKLQANVASMYTYGGMGYVTLVASEGNFSNVEAIDNPSPEDAPAGVVFPYGFFSYTIEDIETGGAATVSIFPYYAASVDTYWKYGPTVENSTPHWYEFLYDGAKGAEFTGYYTILLHLIDGDLGDSDLEANNEIAELGAPGLKPLEAPDLIITDVWIDNDTICYQIMNIGEADTINGHHTRLFMDTVPIEADLIEVDISPEERLTRCFVYTWNCTPPVNIHIDVCADDDQVVNEDDENNNCRREDWQCDTAPPEITSLPVASEITQNSVYINWVTDTLADSTVMFSTNAGAFELPITSPQFTQNHQIFLENLEPSTTYHYIVLSADESGNTTQSRKGFFQTALATDGPTSDITDVIIQKGEGDNLYYTLTADVSNISAMERVEFYMDGELIEIAYSPPFEVIMAPAYMGMSYREFLREHEIVAVAYDRLMGMSVIETLFDPPYQCDIIRLLLQEPSSSNEILYIDGSTVPYGTMIPITVRASMPRSSCSIIPGMRGYPGFDRRRCIEELYQVSEVRFYVNTVLIDTLRPEDVAYGYVFSTDWDAGHAVPGDYQIRVDAIHDEECMQTVIRTLKIEVGEPSLDITREVTRIGNYFQVDLVVENRGTGTATFDKIKDNIWGFQPIAKSSIDYDVTFRSSCRVELCFRVEIDLPGSHYSLEGGSSKRVSYLAVPILFPVEVQPEYMIGKYYVTIWEYESFLPGYDPLEFDMPCVLTEDGLPLSTEVDLAIRLSDFLIVTNTRRLLQSAANTSDVYRLFSSMAELARYRNGILGYVSGLEYDNRNRLKECIRIWGASMRSADGIEENFLSNGYLLLVGETEIIPSYTIRISYVNLSERVLWTDMRYGQMSGNRDPELRIGRVIGDNPLELIIPIQTSVNVIKGEPGFEFDRSHAFVIAGSGDGAEKFERNVDQVEEILDDEFVVTNRKKREVENSGGDIEVEFKNNDGNMDVFFYRDHCTPTSWSGVINTDHFGGGNPIDFEDAKPFVFACCCQAGRYEDTHDSVNIAESFLQNGTAVYIGSTMNSFRDQNNRSARWFYDHWVGTPKSIGQVFNELKDHLGEFYGDHWSYEYNLYGDPKYGGTDAVASAGSLTKKEIAAPLSPYEVVIPDYEISSVDGADYVEIPGGNMLLEQDKTAVPFYKVTLEYPAGHTVQDVTLTDRSGLEYATGLNIPLSSLELDAAADSNAAADGTEEWWPLPEKVFDWNFQTRFDGTSLLTITMFPFYYNSLTTDVKFYKNYIFDIQSISTGVGIKLFTTDRSSYAQGESVKVNLWASNSGIPQDVLAEIVVKDESSDEVVDGLDLRTLNGLTGTSTLSFEWDTIGFEAGNYYMEANIRDSVGNILKSQKSEFCLGISLMEIENFSATLESSSIDTSLSIMNMGTVALEGTAIIKIHNEDNEIITEFRHEFIELPPAETLSFTDSWDTTGAENGIYHIQTYVGYDSKSSEIKNVFIPICANLSVFANIFGLAGDNSQYDIRVDYDRDGDVDGQDLFIWTTYLLQDNCP